MSVQTVRTLHLPVTDFSWPFARDNAKEIAANFAQMQAATPQLWNGPILLARKPRMDGDGYSAEYFPASYAQLSRLARLGLSRHRNLQLVRHGRAALRVTAPSCWARWVRTRQIPARIYFPAGHARPDRHRQWHARHGRRNRARDRGGSRPRAARTMSQRRTGAAIVDGQRIALIRVLQSPLPAAALRDKITRPRSPSRPSRSSPPSIWCAGSADVTDAMPSFMVTYLRHAFG